MGPAANDAPGGQGTRDILEPQPPLIGDTFLCPSGEASNGCVEFFPRVPHRDRLVGCLRQAGDRSLNILDGLEENVEGRD
jgi:hypothetical protein